MEVCSEKFWSQGFNLNILLYISFNFSIQSLKLIMCGFQVSDICWLVSLENFRF